MGSSTRGVLVGLALFAVAFPLAAATAARLGSSALRVACPARVFSVEFRPKGSVSEHRPHAKVYSQRAFFGLVYPKQLSFGPACKAVGDTKKLAWDGGRARTIARSVTLKCRVPARPQLRGAPFVGANGTYAGNRLVATLGHTSKIFLRATMKKSGSSLRFDTRYCKKR
jgi:hypothetical protein